MGYGRRTAAAGAAAVLALTLVACGSDEPASSPSASNTPTDNVSTTPEGTPSPTPGVLSGTWAEDPGQSDRVQQALVAKGFTCTRHSDPGADLRMCSLAKPYPKKDGVDISDHAAITFLADLKGTVVLADFSASGHNEETKESLQRAMVGKIVPAADVEVLLADGKELTWGKYQPMRPNTEPGDKDLIKTGFDQIPGGYLPHFESMPVTKEQVLPKLKATKLKCSFVDGINTEPDHLDCYDTTFDGISAKPPLDARATFSVIDGPAGVNAIHFAGENGDDVSTKNAIRKLAPRLSAVDPSLQPIADWVLANLDGVGHEAFFGGWRVDFHGGNSMGHSSYRVSIAPQEALGVEKP